MRKRSDANGNGDQLAQALFARAQRIVTLGLQSRDGATSDEDLEYLRRALDTVAPVNPRRPNLLDNFGVLLLERFVRTGAAADLDEAIDLFEQAVAASPQKHRDRGGFLSNLGIALQTRYERTGRAADLDRSITLGRQALAAAPLDHSARSNLMATLANALRLRCQLTGGTAGLGGAIRLSEYAVQACPVDHRDRPRFVSILGSLLLTRFTSSGGVADLDRAIALGEKTLATTPADNPDRPRLLDVLGAAAWSRFLRTGSEVDLDRSIDLGGQAVAAVSHNYLSQLEYMSNLGTALQSRFLRSGRGSDQDRAIDLYEQAVKISQPQHFNRPVLLSNLGNALHSRFPRSGSEADLDRAIDLYEQAVDITPPQHPNRPTLLYNLGNARQSRFLRSGSGADLDRALDFIEQAVNIALPEHPNRPAMLSSFGKTLQIRSLRSGSRADLDRGINLAEQAVNTTPADHFDRPRYLSNLGKALQLRSLRIGSEADLDRAIDLAEQAAETTPADHPDRPEYLANLGWALQLRYQRSDAEDDLDRAIKLAGQAVDTTPGDHPDRPRYLSNLGEALQMRHQHTGIATDLNGALEAFREATTITSGSFLVRAHAARLWGRAAVVADNWAEAVEGYRTAVALAELVVPRQLARADQEFRLGALTGLGSEAAAVCLQAKVPDLQAKLPELAVELLEQGRAMMFSRILDVRSDMTDLRQAHPALADRFASCRDVLDRADSDLADSATAGMDTARRALLNANARRAAADEFERVLTDIRALPGFERFLAPRRFTELLPAAAYGPVVLLNIDALRSDALIVTTDGVTPLPMPGVGPKQVIEQTVAFLSALANVHDGTALPEARDAAEEVMARVLGWLGDRIIGRVLEHLGYVTTPPDDARWPRVWWCATGVLALLPLHAAGHHKAPGDASGAVIDRVISSTIPTLRALIHARRTAPSALKPRVLVVAMPHTPGKPDLPDAAEEAVILQRLLAPRVTVLGLADTNEPADFATVTERLPSHDWVHFCCHGESDLINPSASHLLLADRPLSVVDLIHTNLPHAELAFLSACSTARTGAALPDEPIHLAAACQLAGYRHVVASLWPIGDSDTAWLANRFYATITDTGVDQSAAALHQATRKLRLLNRDRPSHWAPYTHTGH